MKFVIGNRDGYLLTYLRPVSRRHRREFHPVVSEDPMSNVPFTGPQVDAAPPLWLEHYMWYSRAGHFDKSRSKEVDIRPVIGPRNDTFTRPDLQ